IKKAIKNLENVSIVNGYGPTENTTFTTTMEFNNSFFSNVPIGKPGVNVKIGVVNKRNMLLPHNCEGEIVIGGENLSSGYLNENITKEKFVTIDEVTDKLYKSGDIGYISSDSTLNYISRIDSQIKLRGYRIELSEIEENLLKHDLVSNCVTEVINNLLVLVYEGQLKTNKAKEFLTNVLPNYMVPNQIIHTDKIPLTLNGKLDKSIIEKFYIENSDNIPA
ncbi:AMP-binding protein, partial [Staphylococcus lugdunensis]